MKVVFRTDASLQIGTGHVMRCLTLAEALQRRGAKCTFICRPHQGHLIELISKCGHQIFSLPSLQKGSTLNSRDMPYSEWLGIDWHSDAVDTQEAIGAYPTDDSPDWLVIDHYALDSRWEKFLRPHVKFIMVIDDLADRHHECDLLLDQNLGRTEQDYEGLVPSNTTRLIGSQYALLRPEFAKLRAQSRIQRENNMQLRDLLIFMGGVDRENATGQVLDVLKTCALSNNAKITVIMGPQAPWLAKIQEQAMHLPWPVEVLSGVSNMAQLLTRSDLAIGAAGGNAWERCCLGLPSLVVVQAENQLASAIALQSAGAVIVLKNFQQIKEIFDSWELSRQTDLILRKLSSAAAAVTDGNGCTHVADTMIKIFHA